MSPQVSVDVRDGAASFEHSTHISTGPISINCSVNYWAHDSRLELWGHSRHDSEALLQAGVPEELDLQAELQMQGEPRSRVQHPLGPDLVPALTQAGLAGSGLWEWP